MYVNRATIAALFLLASAVTAGAQTTIVAFGTSNSAGRGVSSSQAYPAQLEAALKAKGYNVSVINMGVNGNSTADMLARVDSVPNGTRLVLVEWARSNENRRNVTNTTSNMAEIRSRLSRRGMKTIDITSAMRLQFQRARLAGNLIPSGVGPHLNEQAITSWWDGSCRRSRPQSAGSSRYYCLISRSRDS